MSTFDFTVRSVPVHGFDRDERYEVGPGWRVYLPHQCDDWDIAGDDYDGVPYADAVGLVERFIAEAQLALAELRKAACT